MLKELRHIYFPQYSGVKFYYFIKNFANVFKKFLNFYRYIKHECEKQ